MDHAQRDEQHASQGFATSPFGDRLLHLRVS